MTRIDEKIMCNIIDDYQNGNSPTKLSQIYNNFSPYIIRENLKLYGVYKNNRFTDEEVGSIRNDYINGMKLCDLAQKYLRPEESIRRKLQNMGVYDTQDHEFYTKEEIEIIKKYYPQGDWDMLFTLMPNRPKSSIAIKASKLGLKQENYNWKEHDVQKFLKQHDLFLNSRFIGVHKYHKLSDGDGYLYRVQLSTIIHGGSIPSKFHVTNPYTIQNIKHYLVLNNIDCHLLSEAYINNTEKLLWKCSCGNPFECSWQDFYSGKHQCNNCGAKIRNDNHSYTIDEVKQLLSDTLYTIVEESFTRISNGFVCTDLDGYKVIMTRQALFEKQIPEVFHPQNPYTIENIKRYLEINNINCELLSKIYMNNTTPLTWKCACGNLFEKPWCKFRSGLILCPKCARKKNADSRKISRDIIVETLKDYGLNLLHEDSGIIAIDSIDVIDKSGYKYQIRYHNVVNGKEPEKFHVSNPYTIDNINTFFSIHRNNEYVCVSECYYGNRENMNFMHIPCGTIFEASWSQMQGKLSDNKEDYYYKQCPKCTTNKTESIHASVLKQIFLHEYPDTIVEDRSCVNINTNYALPTDIVNHNLKIAVEIQSSYHDYDDKKILDKIKKNFWINKGYKFYDPDIRDYSIIQMVQLFFPNIHEVPEYIDYHFGDCIDFNELQALLDKGKSIKEISNITGVKHGTINALCLQHKLVLPKDYKKRILNQKPIVRLSKDNVLMKRYTTLSSVKIDGLSPSTIRNVLIGERKFSYGSFWLYEDDYLKGNYVIPEEDDDHFLLSVDKFDMENNYVCSYRTTYEAENDSTSNRNEIYRVAMGERKSSRNEKWKFNQVA